MQLLHAMTVAQWAADTDITKAAVLAFLLMVSAGITTDLLSFCSSNPKDDKR